MRHGKFSGRQRDYEYEKSSLLIILDLLLKNNTCWNSVKMHWATSGYEHIHGILGFTENELDNLYEIWYEGYRIGGAQRTKIKETLLRKGYYAHN